MAFWISLPGIRKTGFCSSAISDESAPGNFPGNPYRAYTGLEIHIQPGYKGSVQGPDEARWGYIGPNVFDWNGDGIPDILASDATARHYVFLNRWNRQLRSWMSIGRCIWMAWTCTAHGEHGQG